MLRRCLDQQQGRHRIAVQQIVVLLQRDALPVVAVLNKCIQYKYINLSDKFKQSFGLLNIAEVGLNYLCAPPAS